MLVCLKNPFDSLHRYNLQFLVDSKKIVDKLIVSGLICFKLNKSMFKDCGEYEKNIWSFDLFINIERLRRVHGFTWAGLQCVWRRKYCSINSVICRKLWNKTANWYVTNRACTGSVSYTHLTLPTILLV